MIYLDYSATTPVDEEVLDEFINTTKKYIGNVNSIHKYGLEAKNLLDSSKRNLAKLFNCSADELIFTSGASESNATAIRGVAEEMQVVGKHIISTKLEHKSVLDELNRLSKMGFEVDYVNIDSNGQVDLENLKKIIKKDTILISICGVNAETGYVQDISSIRKVINETNPRIIFHSDLTQGLGKIKIDLSLLDLASFSGHKIYAPVGCGLLYKSYKRKIRLLISGTTSNYPYRGGSISLPMVVAFTKAVAKALENMEANNEKCKVLNKKILSDLKKYNIHINSNEYCISQIINFSLIKVKGSAFVKMLSDKGVCVSSGSACCASIDESITLDTVYNEKSISMSSIRISLSHLTTEEEIERFLKIFNELYYEL